MSQSRKRSRKSKLEVRDDDCEYELVTVSEKNDEATPHLQIKQNPNYNLDLDHDYCKSIPPPMLKTNYVSTIIGLQEIQSPTGSVLSVKVEVEQLDIKRKRSSEKRSDLRNMEKEQKIKFKGKKSIKMCKYDPEMLYKVSKEIALKSNNPADRILDIEMRNLWGNVLSTPNVVSPHETLLQLALEMWQLWYNASRLARDSPLFYQCHICTLAWWRLQPFRDHLKLHDIKDLKVTLKENIHECMIIASNESVNNLLYIDIDEDCWKCGKDLDFHRKCLGAYSCYRCKRSSYTCSALSDHESTCLYCNISNFNITLERQCTICGRVLDSLKDVEKHMVLSHSVRSDVPVAVLFKECSHCHIKYFKYSTHNCPKSVKNSSCDNCCRKFATKPLALAHTVSVHNRQILCRICAVGIPTKCQEMEHLLTDHSKNYQFAYKCTICSNQYLLFKDQMSIRLHRQLWHQKKSDKRRSYYEMMVVPKHCLETGGVEEAFQIGNDHDYEEAHYTNNDSKSNKKQSTKKRKRKRGEDDSVPSTSTNSLRLLTADIDVTVDEVDIKKEPIEYGENGEIDYEEMLRNMFDDNRESSNNETVTFTETTDEYEDIKIKTEPIDQIDIEENPVELIKVKSEPIDEEYINTTKELFVVRMKENELENETELDKMTAINMNPSETLLVKVENDINMDNMKPEDIVIKNEIDDDTDNITEEGIPLDQLITDLKDLKSNGDMEWVSEEVINPDEMSFNFLNPSGLYKRKKVYACHKCGYTAQHKQYKLHISSKCTVSPGINGSYSCSKCNLTFVMFRNYVLHFDTHGYELMSCPKCGMTFSLLVKLLSHVHKHIKSNFVGVYMLKKGGEESTKKKKQVKCQECRAVVLQRDMFPHWEKHLTLKDASAKPAPAKETPPELTVDFERVTMNNKTLEPGALRLAIEHLQANDGYSTDKECVICYRAFSRRYDVKRHIVEHLLMDAHMNKFKYKAFRCQICSADFQGQEQYKFHMREHGCMPIFKCELCDKTFSDSSNFAKHKKTHNVRVLVCDLCNKKFHSKNALQKHISDHARLGLTQCAFCEAKFISKQEYKRHKFQVHVKNKFRCVLCDISFYSLQQKWDHNWEVHKERKQNADCPICLKSFRKFQDVRIHARNEHRNEVHQVKQHKQNGLRLYKIKELKLEKVKQ